MSCTGTKLSFGRSKFHIYIFMHLKDLKEVYLQQFTVHLWYILFICVFPGSNPMTLALRMLWRVTGSSNNEMCIIPMRNTHQCNITEQKFQISQKQIQRSLEEMINEGHKGSSQCNTFVLGLGSCRSCNLSWLCFRIHQLNQGPSRTFILLRQEIKCEARYF